MMDGGIRSADEDLRGTVLMMWVVSWTVTGCSEPRMVPVQEWSENVWVKAMLASLVEMSDLRVAILVEK